MSDEDDDYQLATNEMAKEELKISEESKLEGQDVDEWTRLIDRLLSKMSLVHDIKSKLDPSCFLYEMLDGYTTRYDELFFTCFKNKDVKSFALELDAFDTIIKE